MWRLTEELFSDLRLTLNVAVSSVLGPASSLNNKQSVAGFSTALKNNHIRLQLAKFPGQSLYVAKEVANSDALKKKVKFHEEEGCEDFLAAEGFIEPYAALLQRQQYQLSQLFRNKE